MFGNKVMDDTIKTIFKSDDKSPDELFDDFFELYEKTYFTKEKFIDGLYLFDSPFKEIIASHQAWGMIGSDGFYGYFEQTDESFDNEVKKGLKMLGFEQCYIALKEARKLYKNNNGAIPENDEDHLWDLFYEPIREFDSIAGLYLVNNYRET